MLNDCGFVVEVIDVDASTQFADIAAGNFTSMTIPLNTTSTWRQATYTLIPDAQFNPFPSADQRVLDLLDIVQGGTDAEATAAAQDLNRLVTEEAWFAPWFFANVFVISNPEVVDLYPHLRNVVPAIWMLSPAS